MHETVQMIIIMDIFIVFILVGLLIGHINIMISKNNAKNIKIHEHYKVKSNKLKVDNEWEQLNKV